MEPIVLTHRLLEEITNNFSEERKIGQGAYGKVYRGERTNGEDIAVKMLHYVGPGLDDKHFQNEFDNLRKLNHENIVKLIGYCYETQHRHMEYEGRMIFVEQTSRALCLEYLHNGSLQKHLSDELDGLDWPTRYKIIKGICEGLKYLHEGFEKPIYHLDLKPDNILLDKNMVPKLADFGLSMLFSKEQTRITQSPIGTVGYLPPEYIERGLVSKKLDIFSLGVVMIKIISGLNGRSKSAEMPRQEVIDRVYANWRNRLQAKWSGSSLEAYCQQVMGCTEIALSCIEIDRHNRPNIVDIIQELTEMETEIDKISRGLGSEILSVEPLQLRFLLGLEPNKSMISSPLHLINRTGHLVIYRLLITEEYLMGPLYGVVFPRCRHTLALTMRNPPARNCEDFILESCIAVGYVGWTSLYPAKEEWEFQFKKAKEKGREVHQVELMALYEPPGSGKTTSEDFAAFSSVAVIVHGDDPSMRQPMKRRIMIQSEIGMVSSLDVHPTEPWILTQQNREVGIWNYQTQEIRKVEIVPFVTTTLKVISAKFVARKQWFVVGVSDGSIYVYSCNQIKKIRHFRAHSKDVNSLAIHAIEPYLLSASADGYIKLWDYEKNWKLICDFYSPLFPTQSRGVRHVMFNPKDMNIFATAENSTIKIWHLHFSKCTKILSWPSSMQYVDYFRRGDELYLIACCGLDTVKIWDCQTGRCVKTLSEHRRKVNAVCSHPDLSILITGLDDGTVCLWSWTTFELECTLNFGLGGVRALGCLQGSSRIVIGHRDGLVLTEIDLGSKEIVNAPNIIAEHQVDNYFTVSEELFEDVVEDDEFFACDFDI